MLDGWRLRWWSRPSLVDRVLRGGAAKSLTRPGNEGFSAVAVQMALRQSRDPTLWIAQCGALVQTAAGSGANVVVFPAHSYLGLICGLGDNGLARELLAANGGRLPAAFERARRRLYPAANRVYQRTFASLARRYGLTIVAGALPAPHQDSCAVGVLFGPDGRIQVCQPAAPPGGFSDDAPAARAGDIPIVVVVGELPEPATVPANGVVAHLPWPGDQRSSAMDAALAETVHCLLVRSCLVGTIDGQVIRGRSGIYAPRALSGHGTGVLAEAESPEAEEVLLGTVPPALLRQGPAEEGAPQGGAPAGADG